MRNLAHRPSVRTRLPSFISSAWARRSAPPSFLAASPTLAPTVALVPLDVVGYVGTLVLVAALAALAAGATWWALRAHGLDPLAIVTGVFVYFVVLPAAFLALTGDFAYHHVAPGPKLAGAVVVLLVGYVAILAGYAAAVEALRRSRPNPRYRLPNDPGVLLLLGVVGIAVGLFAFGYFVAVNGGLVRLMTVRPRTAFQQVPHTGRFRVLGLAGIFGGWLTTWIALHPVVDDPRESPVSTWGLLLVATVGLAVAFAVLSRERLKILYILTFSVVYLATTCRVDLRRIVVLGGALVLFGVFFTTLEQTLVGAVRLADLFHSVVDPLRLEALMEVVAKVPRVRPYQWGATYLRTFATPRTARPLAYGDQVELLLRGRNVPAIGFSAMLWGEMWLNFGPLGLVVGSGIYGAGIGAISWFKRHAADSTARGLSAVLVATVAVAIPAASTWITKVLVAQTLLPVLAALAVAALVERVTTEPAWASSRF